MINNTLSFAAAILLALLCSGCNPRGRVESAEAAVNKFHQRYNAQDYSAMYDEAGSAFRASASKTKFTDYEANVRAKLGAFESSQIGNYNLLYLLKGPQVRLDYNSQFAKGRAVESFEVDFEDDKPVINAYRIDTPLVPEKK